MKKLILIIVSIIFFNNINAQKQFWGVTPKGGKYDAGVIFKTDSLGNNQEVEYDFYKSEGSSPQYTYLVETADGLLYGLTTNGGAHGKGVLFQYNPVSGAYIKKVDFDSLNGSYPQGSLLLAQDGKLYGLTTEGGANNLGVVFQYDPGTNTLIKKIDFNGINNGASPFGSLMQASNGKLYGLASGGGLNNFGVIFEYDLSANTLIKRFDFDNTVYGCCPFGKLLEASDGKLYGLAAQGSVGNAGTVFNYDPVTLICTKKADMNTAGIAFPYGSLEVATDGNFYGMAQQGGINNDGAIFQYNPVTFTITKKLDFNESTNGKWPRGSLISALDGKLYGMTYIGGSSFDEGVLFSFDPTTSLYTIKLQFHGSTGIKPRGTLMQASNGKMYGLTTEGGLSGNSGVLFEYVPGTNTYVKKVDLNGNDSGFFPTGSLLKASDGNLYGVSYYGGLFGKGVLYQYNPVTHVYTKKIDFDGTGNGSFPESGLLQASDGKLYGLTSSGGASNNGILFQYDYSTNTLINKVNFDGALNGGMPSGSLIEASDGNLYGMTEYGGTNDFGVLFQFNPSLNSFVKKIDFAGGSNGKYPLGKLFQASNGKLYGSTLLGGLTNDGVLFQYDITTGVLTKKIDFDGATTGSGPNSSFTELVNGKIYGTCYWGGTINKGVLFEYDSNLNTLSKKIDFNNIAVNGGNPVGGLLKAWNGKLYGLTQLGGINNDGVIFEYDPTTSNYTKKMDFDKVNGSSPRDFDLIQISVPNSIITSPTGTMICAGGNMFVPYIVSGVYDTGNIFTAQLSDASGSFSSAISIGSLNSIFSGSISVSLPGLISSGTGYRIRVVSSNPAITGTDNGAGITINSCADVWPGDANSDGVADNLDVLELGLHYTQTGAPRASISNNWQSYFANNWTGTITNGKNMNHSDCNGDGIISDDDTLAIFNNYGLTHAFKPTLVSVPNPQLQIVPDQPMLVKGTWGTASIYLGDASAPIADINGLAFTVNFDNSLIETNKVWIEYHNSFMDAGQNLHFRKLDFATNKLYTATTHTLSSNTSGYGKIATLHYQINSNLTTDEVLNFSVYDCNQSDAYGAIVPLTTGAGTVMVIGASVGISEINNQGVYISPNPTSDILGITYSKAPQNATVEIYNTLGAIVYSGNVTDRITTIHTTGLPGGVYYIRLIENSNTIWMQKIIKQ